MKFLAVLFLTVFAVTYVYADSDECTEERAEACIDNLLNSILDDNSEEEVCRELRSSVDCLKDAVDDCLEERDEEVEEGLEELEKLFKDNCKPDDDDSGSDSDDDSEEIEKCFEENQDYIFECIHAGTNEALNVLMEKGDLDENTLTCAEIRHAINCLKDALDDCREDEEVEDGLRELESLLQENCGNGVVRPKSVVAQRHEQQELEVISECMAKNEAYINHCIYEGSTAAMSILTAEASENLLKCAMYGMMASCYVERVGERCGDKASKLADEELAHLPPEISSACETAGVYNIYYFQFPSNRRRK